MEFLAYKSPKLPIYSTYLCQLFSGQQATDQIKYYKLKRFAFFEKLYVNLIKSHKFKASKAFTLKICCACVGISKNKYCKLYTYKCL